MLLGIQVKGEDLHADCVEETDDAVGNQVSPLVFAKGACWDKVSRVVCDEPCL